MLCLSYAGKWSVDISSIKRIPKFPSYLEANVKRELPAAIDCGKVAQTVFQAKLSYPESTFSLNQYVMNCDGGRGARYVQEEYDLSNRRLMRSPAYTSVSALISKIEEGYASMDEIARRVCRVIWELKEDKSKGAERTTESVSIPKQKPAPSKDIVASQSKGTTFSIPLRQRGGVFEVMATLNSEVKVFFVVDSGASDVTIPESVAGLLIDNGSLTKADVLGAREYTFANGDSSSGKVVRLRTLDLDGHILRDVRAVVLPGKNVPVLLGQSALGQLGSWSINAKAKKLEVTP